MTVDFAWGNSRHGQLLLDQWVNNTGVRHAREKSFTKWPQNKIFFGQTGVNGAQNFCIIQQFETPQDFEAILGS